MRESGYLVDNALLLEQTDIVIVNIAVIVSCTHSRRDNYRLVVDIPFRTASCNNEAIRKTRAANQSDLSHRLTDLDQSGLLVFRVESNWILWPANDLIRPFRESISACSHPPRLSIPKFDEDTDMTCALDIIAGLLVTWPTLTL